MRTRSSLLLLAGLTSACAWACSGTDSNAPPGSGGSSNGGDGAALGGTSSNGGVNTTGGALPTGGASSNVGSSVTGGAATGGAPATGGALPTGGSQASATGGKAATGGAPPVTGGAMTGGSKAAGGSVNGGASATGGSKAATGGRAFGGTSNAGGSKATGGSRATGGSGTGAGGGTCVPNYTCTPTAPNTGDIYADCVARINQFRACVCLPPVTRNTSAEACLNQDAQNDQTNQSAHQGFINNICTPQGNAQNECPGWLGWNSTTQAISQCIQSMFNEGPPPTTPCTGTCYETYGHYINMTGNYTRAACGFYTAPNGQVTAVQNFYP